MDENYLDSLLGQVSSKEKTKNKSILDDDMDIDLSDLGDISLDEMDDLDGIDLSGLDLDDIDFDDVDVLDLNIKKEKKKSSMQQNDDFNLDSLVEEEEKKESAKQEEQDAFSNQEVFEEAEQLVNQDVDVEEMFRNMGFDMNDSSDELTEDTPAEQDIDHEAEDTPAEQDIDHEAEDTPAEQGVGREADDTPTEQDVENMDLDDLFSALGIENDENDNSDSEEEFNEYTAGQGDLDDLFQASMELSMESGDLDDIQDISDVKGTEKKKPKKQKKQKKSKEKDEITNFDINLDDADGGKKNKKGKRTLSEILFGTPDLDEIEEEKYYEEQRAIKKEKKQAKKEEKKAEKQEKLELKKADDEKKQKEKENKKKVKIEKYEAELEAEKDEKKVSNITVLIVFVLFAAIAGTVIFGTKEFNYSQVIKKATDYFSRQRYRLAYDEVSGVDVKKKDEELRDRIYTVMYVERLFESYENNMSLGRADKALDALLRGLEKYDEHYEEAVELDIVEDIVSCRAKIMFALADTFGIDEDIAYSMMELEGQAYTNALNEYSSQVKFDENN